MAKYRKKPVVIEAEQYWPDKPLPAGVETQVVTASSEAHRMFNVPIGTEKPIIRTLEGIHHVQPGDWIITGVKGERYPCKPDIFEATYEPA